MMAEGFKMHRRLSVSSSGSAAVEFAIIAPVLVMLLAGVVCFGLYFGVANGVQQLAADAARASVSGMNDDERAKFAKSQLAKAVNAYAFLDPKRAQVRAGPSSVDPEIFEVSISYDASQLAIWSFATLLPLPPSTIVRSAAIRRGGF